MSRNFEDYGGFETAVLDEVITPTGKVYSKVRTEDGDIEYRENGIPVSQQAYAGASANDVLPDEEDDMLYEIPEAVTEYFENLHDENDNEGDAGSVYDDMPEAVTDYFEQESGTSDDEEDDLLPVLYEEEPSAPDIYDEADENEDAIDVLVDEEDDESSYDGLWDTVRDIPAAAYEAVTDGARDAYDDAQDEYSSAADWVNDLLNGDEEDDLLPVLYDEPTAVEEYDGDADPVAANGAGPIAANGAGPAMANGAGNDGAPLQATATDIEGPERYHLLDLLNDTYDAYDDFVDEYGESLERTRNILFGEPKEDPRDVVANDMEKAGRWVKSKIPV